MYLLTSSTQCRFRNSYPIFKLSIDRDNAKVRKTSLLRCCHAGLTFCLYMQPILQIFFEKIFKNIPKQHPFFRDRVSLKNAHGRKEGRKRIRKTFKFLCRLPVSALRDKHQRLVRYGSPLSVLDRFQGYRDERNSLQISHRLLKLKE